MSGIDIRLNIRLENPSVEMEAALMQFLDLLRAQGVVAAEGMPDAQTLALWTKLDVPIPSLEEALSIRTRNCLRNDRIRYIGDLVDKSERECLRIPNFGRKCMNEVKAYLEAHDLCFEMDRRGWREKTEEWPEREV